MATKLASTIIPTPHPETKVTPIIKRPIWGRIYDSFLIGCALIGALLVSLGDFNYTSLGFSEKQAAWIGLAVFCVRFVLAWQPPRLLDVKSEPTAPGGQG